MKKALSILIAVILVVSLLTGCGSAAVSGDNNDKNLKKIVIGASPAPHAQILAIVKNLLLEQGYDLEIKEFTDFVQPNLTLQNGELDANYFQHKPYMDDFNTENKTELVALTAIHYEPLGVYPGKTKALADLKDGAKIAVPNDTTNEARALLLLEAQGLIKISPEAGLEATAKDIVDNPKNVKIIEIEAAQLARSLPDVDLAVINGNYAIQAGLNVATDALAKEEADSLAATTYANILAVRKGDEDRTDIKALVEALKSEQAKKFIEETYKGAVVPVF